MAYNVHLVYMDLEDREYGYAPREYFDTIERQTEKIEFLKYSFTEIGAIRFCKEANKGRDDSSN